MTWVQRTLYVLGVAAVAYGAYWLVTALSTRSLIGLAIFVAVGIVLHDGVIAPLAALTGVTVRRLVPQRARRPVLIGLIVTGSLLAVAWPMVLRLGADPVNPSFLPRDYTAGLFAAISVVWVGVAVALLARRITRAR